MSPLLRTLLRPFLPDHARPAILAELDRERRARGPGRHRLWVATTVLGMMLHFTWHRLRGGTHPDITGAPRGRKTPMNALRRDIAYAVRSLRRSPGFAAVAVATTALGIGASVAMFTVVKTVVLDPLPYRDAQGLVVLWEWNVPRDRQRNVANPGNVKAWEARSTTLADIAAATLTSPATLEAPGEPEEITIRMVTPDWFRVLGLSPARGRDFTPAGVEGVEEEVLLSHAFWLRRFGGDPDVVGSTLRADGDVAPIVGVLPDDFVLFGEDVDAWVRYPDASWARGDQTNTGRYLQAIGRLAPPADVASAQAELRQIGAALEAAFPDFNGGWTVDVVPLQEQVVGDVRRGLLVLLGAAGLLLLIACANVAGLLLARGTQRAREMAVRTSLGAGRGALVRQLLVESLVLATAGAVAGVALAAVGVRILAASMPDAFALPRVEAAGIDGTVLLVAAVATAAVGVLFGLVPALRAAGTSPAVVLQAEARGSGRGGLRLRGALVAGQVGICVVLLAGASLLSRSFAALGAVDMGLDPAGVTVARVSLSGDRWDDDAVRARTMADLTDALAAIPGVRAAGAITFLPMAGLGSATSFTAVERTATLPRPDWPAADIRNVVGDYFGAMDIAVLRGRSFDGRDGADAPPVAVVNRALADGEWPGQDPIGRRVAISWGELEEVEVVGVVEDVRLSGPETAARPAIYLPYAQKPWFEFVNLAVRADRPSAGLRAEVEARVAALAPGVPVADLRAMEDVVGATTARRRTTTFLMILVAGLASFLAAVGLYAILAFSVARRAREIGIRVALGAGSREVVGLVTRQGLRLVLLGLVPGLLMALAARGLLESLLFGVPATDPLSLAAAAVLLLLVAAAASAVPAWRALRVQPGEALRSE